MVSKMSKKSIGGTEQGKQTAPIEFHIGSPYTVT